MIELPVQRSGIVELSSYPDGIIASLSPYVAASAVAQGMTNSQQSAPTLHRKKRKADDVSDVLSDVTPAVKHRHDMFCKSIKSDKKNLEAKLREIRDCLVVHNVKDMIQDANNQRFIIKAYGDHLRTFVKETANSYGTTIADHVVTSICNDFPLPNLDDPRKQAEQLSDLLLHMHREMKQIADGLK